MDQGRIQKEGDTCLEKDGLTDEPGVQNRVDRPVAIPVPPRQNSVSQRRQSNESGVRGGDKAERTLRFSLYVGQVREGFVLGSQAIPVPPSTAPLRACLRIDVIHHDEGGRPTASPFLK